MKSIPLSTEKEQKKKKQQPNSITINKRKYRYNNIEWNEPVSLSLSFSHKKEKSKANAVGAFFCVDFRNKYIELNLNLYHIEFFFFVCSQNFTIEAFWFVSNKNDLALKSSLLCHRRRGLLLLLLIPNDFYCYFASIQLRALKFNAKISNCQYQCYS